MNTSDQVNELALALSKAQGEIKGAVKDSLNPHFKATYADLNSVWNACREALSKNGLAVVQGTAPSEKGTLRIITKLIHSTGQWIESTLDVPLSKIDAQGLGSAYSYGRRYSLSAIVGVTQEDDDAEGTKSKDNQAKPSLPDAKPKVIPPKNKATIEDEFFS